MAMAMATWWWSITTLPRTQLERGRFRRTRSISGGATAMERYATPLVLSPRRNYYLGAVADMNGDGFRTWC